MPKKPAVDRERFPHDYTGPTTKWGLARGSACRIVGRGPGGGRRIVTENGRRWLVGAKQVRHAG